MTENDNEMNHHWIIIDTRQGDYEAIGIFSIWDSPECGIELGYCLSDMYWQQGIMSTVISTVCQWLFTHPHCTRIWATCDISNVGSRKALTKADFHYEKLLPNHTL